MKPTTLIPLLLLFCINAVKPTGPNRVINTATIEDSLQKKIADFINDSQNIRISILHHPLFDPEAQNSEGLNAYELLENYNLTEFLENPEY